MPKVYVTHYNPKTTWGKTGCGRRLSFVKHFTDDINDATCNNCIKRYEERKT